MVFNHSEIVLYIIKLVLSGVMAFFAIMLWSRTKDTAWMCIVAGVVTGYVELVYELLCALGVVFEKGPYIAGISLMTLIFTVVPFIFFIAALILINIRNR